MIKSCSSPLMMRTPLGETATCVFLSHQNAVKFTASSSEQSQDGRIGLAAECFLDWFVTV